MQLALSFEQQAQDLEREVVNTRYSVAPFKSQLLKWVGNKQRFAHEIVSFFPNRFGVYHEPFIGSGAVLGALSPKKAVASDVFETLISIWTTLKADPNLLHQWYSDRWNPAQEIGKVNAYNIIKSSYNTAANAADLLFLSRACYGGVIRFRKADGFMSTPCGVHDPISPSSFACRVKEWSRRVSGTTFITCDFEDALNRARASDVVYCDPPYGFSQAILYGAQDFDIDRLINAVVRAKSRGVFVALSIDGSKKSGAHVCRKDFPRSLFEREVAVNIGRSMLRRFQMAGLTLEAENVTDRLLLTH